jgi:hypothetical protein
LAVEWKAAESSPKIMLSPGERRREHVVSRDERQKYPRAAPELLAAVAAVLCDTGLRPDDSFGMVWEATTWDNGKYGTQRQFR